MVGGSGPGPYRFLNNYAEGSGTCWHHDDSGHQTYARQGYDYRRNYIVTPAWALVGHAENKGYRYYHRHWPEWKGGSRGQWIGNLLGGSQQEDTPIGDLIEITATDSGSGVRDWKLADSVWTHGGFAFSGPYIHPGAGAYAPYLTRVWFENNLIWDISGSYCAYNWGGFCTAGNQGAGVIFDLNDSAEDWVARHNTIAYPSGAVPTLLSIRAGQQELFIENNFLHVNVGSFRPGAGIRFVNGANDHNGASCETQGAGLPAFQCLSPFGSWRNNVLTSDGYTAAQLGQQWPGSFLPATPEIGSSIGWTAFTAPNAFGRYALKANWMSGDRQHATDGTDIGVDMQRIQRAIGYVQLGAVTPVTSTAVTVHFSDAAGNTCKALDVATDAHFLAGQYRRFWVTAADQVEATGLTAHTTYQFRLLCAAMSFAGQFQTQ